MPLNLLSFKMVGICWSQQRMFELLSIGTDVKGPHLRQRLFIRVVQSVHTTLFTFLRFRYLEMASHPAFEDDDYHESVSRHGSPEYALGNTDMSYTVVQK